MIKEESAEMSTRISYIEDKAGGSVELKRLKEKRAMCSSPWEASAVGNLIRWFTAQALST